MTKGHATRTAGVQQTPLHLRRRTLTGLGLVWVGLITACSTTQVSRPVVSSDRASAPYNGVRNDLALFALSLLDTAYKWGGRGPATGFDCSGLVAHVYREGGGIAIQGSSAELGRKSKPIDRSALLPGDLVFFNTLGARHSHVGVYVGGGRFVHASNPRTGVRLDHLSNRYYAQRFEGAHSLLE
ncbi:C40 family peptidase [Limnohabitans sp.]|uniref:C40 family peptidase n=1 Tax=Limnohabitans sp. TaxID=1907725 RepID=UPI0039BCD132|nr:C40 family peptidase [Comamonadaceae bacterium]